MSEFLAFALIESDGTHEIPLTFAVDQFDPTLPHFQRPFTHRFFSEERSDVGGPEYVRTNPCVRAGVVRKCNGSPFYSREEPHIVVLGGGITGLSTAYHLARKFPTTKVTLIEGSNRVGGWLNSDRVDVGTGTVLLERGPRTLRSSSKPALELVRLRYLLHAR